jgi:hypothetical protein
VERVNLNLSSREIFHKLIRTKKGIDLLSKTTLFYEHSQTKKGGWRINILKLNFVIGMLFLEKSYENLIPNITYLRSQLDYVNIIS